MEINAIIRELSEPFPAEAIHWRAQQVAQKGQNAGKAALALAYLDSRDVQDRLDRVTGGMWQAEHFDCGGGKLGCKIGILIGDHWVWKSDGAGDTDIEAQKGAFSGAFKRAAVHWGIGRYLYDLGNTWVPCESWQKGEKFMFRRFTADPWKHVKGAPNFTPEHKGDNPADAKFAELKNALETAASTDILRAVWDEFTKHQAAFSADQVAELTALKDTCKQSLRKAA